jgi:hypothetical protein
VLSDWKEEEEPIEVQNEFNTRHHLPTACTAIPSVNDGETFFGTSREVAKTQVADSPVEEANLTVKGYYTSHPSDADMQKSSISTSCDAERVDVERKNVTVAAYLIAAKKENDNDYHLILQDKDCKDPRCRLTVEMSGIPRLNGSQTVLKTARQAFKEQLLLYTPSIEFPDSGHYLFFKTPILVRVTGSAFYDADHPVNPDTGTGPVGPDCCKPGSTWEVHPVTSFEFVPQTEVSPFALINRAHNE